MSFGAKIMALDLTTVAKIAALAKLELTPDEQEKFQTDINNTLQLIDQLQTIDTDGVKPLAHPLEVNQPLRPDEITETEQRDKLQQGAPAVENGLFLVPKVIE